MSRTLTLLRRFVEFVAIGYLKLCAATGIDGVDSPLAFGSRLSGAKSPSLNPV